VTKSVVIAVAAFIVASLLVYVAGKAFDDAQAKFAKKLSVTTSTGGVR
jgi:hypothetical protein